MLFYSFIPFFIIISHQFLFTNAIPLGEDKLHISFVRNDQKMQISEYSLQKYKAYLGIMHFMRMNWHCDKIATKFEEYEGTECQKYRKCSDILYEYLSREYVGIPTVKPIFCIKKQIEIEAPIIYAVNCLVRISQFYFIKSVGQYYQYKLNKLKMKENFVLKLLNQERLNMNKKLSINEMILQLAIDTAYEWQTNESLDGITRQIFDENLKEMFKKAAENAIKNAIKYESWRAKQINDDKHLIIIRSKFEDKWNWIDDALFSEFVKGLATNSEKFFKMAEEYLKYLSLIRKIKGEDIDWYDEDRHMLYLGINETQKIEMHLKQKNKARLGVIYLMQKNWHCEKIGKKLNLKKRNECQKYRNYMDILYEYLFRLNAEAKNPTVSKQFPALVKPIFFIGGRYPRSLIDVVKNLNDISKCFWQKGENEMMNVCYKFKRKMKKIWKNVNKEKAKFDEAIKETENDKEKEYQMKQQYDDIFGTFNSSPFSYHKFFYLSTKSLFFC